ncbi:MAG: LytR C-terminal domain-containing protein [Actinomycetes bacterium]
MSAIAPEQPANGQSSTGSQPVVRAAMRQRKAQKRRKRATVVQGAFTTLFVVALIGLGFVGWKSALKITGGRVAEVTNPADPDFIAKVEPTNVDLVAITATDGSLLTMLFLLSDPEANKKGPEAAAHTVVPMSSGLILWEFEDAPPDSAANIFASGGIDALSLRLGADLSFGSTSTTEVSSTVIDELAALAGPLSVELPDNVLGPDAAGGTVVKYPAGPLVLQSEQVTEFLGFRGIDEEELTRSLRLKLVWTQLLGAIGASESSKNGTISLPSSASKGLKSFGDLLDRMPNVQVSLATLPTKEVVLNMSPPVKLNQVDGLALPSWVGQFVPFPTSAYPGQRATVSMLNGTTDRRLPNSVAPKVVAGGGQISLAGNAASFEVETSTVNYTESGSKQAAEAIAQQLGLAASLDPNQNSNVDVTVTMGQDLLR